MARVLTCADLVFRLDGNKAPLATVAHTTHIQNPPGHVTHASPHWSQAIGNGPTCERLKLRVGIPQCDVAGFGLPNRRKRVFVLASLHGDARDVLLSQVRFGCCVSRDR